MLNLFVFPTCMLKPENPVKHWVDVSISWIISQDRGGVGTNCKDAGVNFYFDWVMVHNNFFNKGVKIPNGEYRMSVHHVLWPVPETAITSNTGGVINQNIGYPGAEDNLEPLKVEPVDPAI